MKILKIFLALLVLGLFLTAGAGVGLYYWAQEDLPGFTKLSDYSPALATTVVLRNAMISRDSFSVATESWFPASTTR